MEFLTDSLREAVSKLNEDQKEELDVIESIINTNEANKESMKEKVIRFVEKQKPENCINFIVGCTALAADINPKERKSLAFLLTSVFGNFKLKYKIMGKFYILRDMLCAKGILIPDGKENKNIFDFAEEGTVKKALFDDNIESLQQLLALCPDEEKDRNIKFKFFLQNDIIERREYLNRIGVAALFGSVKCFKYLMMNGDEINEDTCKFAVAGGNMEIIHLCEQKGLVFEGCLQISSMYHRFEIFEWLNTHFNYEEVPLSEFIRCYNEPLFYFYSFSGSDIEMINEYDGCTSINSASQNGQLEVVKYLYETCHANTVTINVNGCTPMNNATIFGHLNIVKYLYETCHANVEIRDEHSNTPMNNAVGYGHYNIVKYLYETCHAKVPGEVIYFASFNGYLDIVKYLYETCHLEFDAYTVKDASERGHLDVVKYLCETCHADEIEPKEF